jgi:prevent-host-death family protein
MSKIRKEISATEFKKTCLKLMDLVKTNRTEVVITKRGKRVAKLVPFEKEPTPVFGYMAGTVQITGDNISPIETTWPPEKEDAET